MIQKSIVVYCISGLFLLAILVQLNSYLAFVTLPTSHVEDNTIIQERYQREYKALVIYIIGLSVTFIILLIHSWLKQLKYNKQKLSGHPVINHTRTRWYWLNYEWKWFNLTLSALFILKLGALALFNILLLLFNSNNEDTDLEGRNLYIQGIANRAAQLAIVNTAIAIALSAKLSIVQRYFYCIQDTLGWHPWFSRLAFVEALYHGTYQFQFNYHRQNSNVLLTLTTNVRYMTGTGLMLAMITLVIGSHPLIRRISYRFFRWTHLLGLFTFILLGCLHHWAFYVFYAAVLVFWILDQIDRSFQVDVCVLESMPGNIVKVQAFVPYHVSNPTPGQFAFLSFSSSWFHAWIGSHPFSICRFDHGKHRKQNEIHRNLQLLASFSVSKENVEGHNESQFPSSNETLENQVLTFYIKAFGKRTLSFYQKAVNQEKVKLRISRPLGRPQLDLSGSEYGDYKTIVLIADGVGITPWISVLQYVHRKERTIKTRSLHLMWSIHTIGKGYQCAKTRKVLT